MIALLAVIATFAGATEFTPARPPNRPDLLLAGTFISCNDAEDGGYGERIFVIRRDGQSVAELHMGPRDSFGLFKGERDEHFEHESDLNLLRPAFHVNDVRPKVGGRNWWIDGLNLLLNVVSIGGSDPDCYYFALELSRGPRRVYAP